MQKGKKELSIVITAYGKTDLLELCIESIQEKIRDEINYEIIVSSSATEESAYDLMREKFSQIVFLPNKENKGFGFVANEGIKKSKGKYLFIINHDIIIKDRAIQKLLAYIKNNRDVGLVGPRLINFDGSIQNSAFRFYSWKTILYRRTFLGRFVFAKKALNKFLLKDKIKKDKIIEVDWIMGSAMMTSAEIVKKVGKFDLNFFMYFEDVDWCWRFWKLGYKVVYNPTIKVAHYHGKASSNKNVLQALWSNKYTRIHIGSALKFFKKHFGEKVPH
jgi:GT2 family glycosyltransferase